MGLITLRELGLGFLGAESECGPKPELKAGDRIKCCPGVGWVIYDSSERLIGLCDRAAGGSGSSPGPGSEGTSFADRMEELEEKRRDSADRRFRQETANMLMRAQLEMRLAEKVKAVRAQTAAQAAVKAKQAAEHARDMARIKAEEEVVRTEQTKKAVTYGAVALLAFKVLALF